MIYSTINRTDSILGRRIVAVLAMILSPLLFAIAIVIGVALELKSTFSDLVSVIRYDIPHTYKCLWNTARTGTRIHG